MITLLLETKDVYWILRVFHLEAKPSVLIDLPCCVTVLSFLLFVPLHSCPLFASTCPRAFPEGDNQDAPRSCPRRHGKQHAPATLIQTAHHCAHAVDGSHRWNSKRTLMCAGCDEIAAITVLKSWPPTHPSPTQHRLYKQGTTLKI